MTPFIYPPEFAGAVIGSRNPQRLSPPQQPIGWKGVILNAPQWVAPARQQTTIIPVCGRFMLPALRIPAPLSGTLHIRIDDLPPIPPFELGLEDPEAEEAPPMPPPAAAEDLEGVSDGGYFCFDLAPHLRLPPHPARIQFTLVIRQQASPIMTVEWRPNIQS